MDDGTKKTIGAITGGCGCLATLALSLWLAFVVYIGVQGRGNDAQVSTIIGGITCCVMLPVLLVTIAGIYFALKKAPVHPPK